MTVKTQVDKVTMPGNGVAFKHPFSPMVIFKETELSVVHVDAAGAETPLTLGTGPTNYAVEVARYPGTGNVVYPADQSTPLPTGEKLVTKRVLTLEQQVELETQGEYDPKVQEGMHDRGIMIAIQQQESIDRAIKVPVSYTGPEVALPVPEAQHLLGWNDSLVLSNFLISAIPGLEVTPWTIGWNRDMDSTDEARLYLQAMRTSLVARAPNVNDDVTQGHQPGDFWADTSAGQWYVCILNTEGGASWDTIQKQYRQLAGHDPVLGMTGGGAASPVGWHDYLTLARAWALPQNAVGTVVDVEATGHTAPIVVEVYATRAAWGDMRKLFDATIAVGQTVATLSNINADLAAGDLAFAAQDRVLLGAVSSMVFGNRLRAALKGSVA